MSILKTFSDYLDKEDNSAQRAVFEAAMVERLSKEGYKMSDLLWELFLCQKDTNDLKHELAEIKEKLYKKKS